MHHRMKAARHRHFHECTLAVWCSADASAQATMNIVTYASPVALQPPVYALGLYKFTQSWRNWRASGRGLLQAGAAGCSGLSLACRLCGH